MALFSHSSVTSCAGMTACLVLLAQTRVGFLSGGRGKSFHQLTPQEQSPRRGLPKGDGGPHSSTADLHDHGTLGYAWCGGGSYIMGCFNGLDAKDQPVLQFLFKDEDLLEAPDDSGF